MRRRPEKPGESFLQRQPLLVYLSLCVVAWLFYRNYVMPPLKIFYHSDSAVPYITTVTPWLPQDFFFWSAERFGEIYAVPWKLFGREVFGATAEAFYSGFFVFFFIGSGFWLATLGSLPLALGFFLMLLPLQGDRVDLLLFPGHLYGPLYFLMGTAFYLLFSAKILNIRHAVLLATCTALTYWQHALVGGFVLSFCCLRVLSERIEAKAWPRKPMLAFVLMLGIYVTLIEIARTWEIEWENAYYFHIEPWPVFVDNFLDFLSRGLTFYVSRTYGFAMLGVILLGTLAGLVTLFKSKAALFTRLFVAHTFLISVFCIILFNAHPRYTVSGRSERYFTFLLPMILLAVCKLREVLPAGRWRQLPAAIMLVLTSLVVDRMLISRQGTLLDPHLVQSKSDSYLQHEHRLTLLVQSGCTGLIDSYWRSYVVTALSDGKFPSSPGDYPRNPVYLDEIMSQPSYCINYDNNFSDRVKQHYRSSTCHVLSGTYQLCQPALAH